MNRVLIIYYSRTGNVEKMARAVEEGVKEEGVTVEVKAVESVKVSDLVEAQGIIIGSPTYYGAAAAQIKSLLDRSVRYHGRLEGKVGAAFTSSANLGGGNESTILGLLQAFLIHGMIVQGDHQGDHYGAVALEAPDERANSQCRRLGQRTAALVKTLFANEEVSA